MTFYLGASRKQETDHQPQIAEKDVKFSVDPQIVPLFFIQAVFMQLFCFRFCHHTFL